MNKMLERAIAKAARLPDEEQEALARLMLEEMEAEHAWDERFTASGNKLGELARRTKTQHAAGETTPLHFPKR